MRIQKNQQQNWRTLSVLFLSFSCSFRQKICHIIGWHALCENGARLDPLLASKSLEDFLGSWGLGILGLSLVQLLNHLLCLIKSEIIGKFKLYFISNFLSVSVYWNEFNWTLSTLSVTILGLEQINTSVYLHNFE